MNDTQHQTLLSEIHLHGVLPALEELTPRVRDKIAGLDTTVVMSVFGGAAASVRIKDSTITVSREALPAGVLLWFWSARHLNRTFISPKNSMPPLPLIGFWNIRAIKAFQSLTDELERVMKPTPERLKDPEFLALHVRMLLRVALGSLPAVARHDPEAHHWVESGPKGLAAFRVPTANFEGWVKVSQSGLETGVGSAPGEPDVRITFRDDQVAFQALEGQLDPFASVALGQVKVEGLVPLADQLSLVMDRIQRYVVR